MHLPIPNNCSTSSLHTTTHGCFVAHLVRRIHFDQCSVETICGCGPPIVNFTSRKQHFTTSSTPTRPTCLQGHPCRRQLQDTTRSHTTSVCTVDQHNSLKHHTAVHHDPKHNDIPRQFVHLQPPFKHFLQHRSPPIRKFEKSAVHPLAAPAGGPPPWKQPFPNTTSLSPKLFLRPLGTFRWPPPWIPRTLHGAMQLQTELTRVLATSCTHQHIQHQFGSCWSGPTQTITSTQWVVSSGTPSPLLSFPLRPKQGKG